MAIAQEPVDLNTASEDDLRGLFARSCSSSRLASGMAKKIVSHRKVSVAGVRVGEELNTEVNSDRCDIFAPEIWTLPRCQQCLLSPWGTKVSPARRKV